MQWYTKINTCFKRDLDKTSPTYNCIIPTELTTPEFELLDKLNAKWEATEKVDGECTSIHLIPKTVDTEVMPGKWTEVEREEIIFRLEVTQRLEELRKEGTEEAMIEAGKLIAEELITNTVDNAGIINGDTNNQN